VTGIDLPGHLRTIDGRISGMSLRTRALAAAVLVIAALGGSSVAAHAMAPPPQCIRDCSPVIIDTTGPCYGVILGNNRTLDNFCYLGPPPPN
jgi:hypothetical protein